MGGELGGTSWADGVPDGVSGRSTYEYSRLGEVKVGGSSGRFWGMDTSSGTTETGLANGVHRY